MDITLQCSLFILQQINPKGGDTSWHSAQQMRKTFFLALVSHAQLEISP
jgi:hypothetical protein